MKVQQLIDILNTLPKDAVLYPQVTAQDGSAWNMQFEVNTNGLHIVQLRMFHEELKTMPKWSEE